MSHGPTHLPLFRQPARSLSPGQKGRPTGDAVQPVAEQVGTPQRSSFLDENEKCALKRILCIVGIVKDAPADRHHHGAVFAHDRGERLRVALVKIALKQSMIFRSRVVLWRNCAQVVHNFL